MSSGPAAEEIWSDARWLAQALDPPKRLVRLIDMTPDAYRAASFLDDRMMQPGIQSALAAWDAVAAAMPADAPSDARWIFHIGHVGSTLVARLLGELPDVLSVREPRLLRDLTFFPAEVRAEFVPGVRALLSRSFAPGQTAVVKATSMVSEIAAELVPADGHALLLFTEPRSYIAGILAGENSREELDGLRQLRAERLARRDIVLEDASASAAHSAAAAWACEMTALEAAGEQIRAPLWFDFDRMLDDMPAAVEKVAGHFGFLAPSAELRNIASGPLMTRYSKAPEHEYSAGLRRQLLADAQAAHRADIDRALAMLNAAADTSPLLARALERSQPE